MPADATCGCPVSPAPTYQHSHHGESPKVLRCRTVRVIYQLPDASGRATAVPEAVCVDPRGEVRLNVTTAARPPRPRLSGMTQTQSSCGLGRDRISVALAGYSRHPVTMIDPAIESHYGTGYERSRLFPGGNSVPGVRQVDGVAGPAAARAARAAAGCRRRPRHLCRAAGQARVPRASGGSGAAARGAGTPGSGQRSGLRLHRRRGRRARTTGASRIAGRGTAVRAAVPPDRGGAAPAGPGRGPAGAAAGRPPAGQGAAVVCCPCWPPGPRPGYGRGSRPLHLVARNRLAPEN